MNYGIKTSRIGYNVHTASDKQLAFSSQWPLLPIEAEGEQTFTPEEGGEWLTEDIYTHGLDYTPVFMVERISGDPFAFPLSFYCNGTKLYLDAYMLEETTVKWKIFRRPIQTKYTSENTDVTDATQGEDSDYGILVSLPGKDIKSTDKRDFSIRSDVRQLMIASSDYSTEPVSGMETTHNLGYKPIYLAYVGTLDDEGDPIEGEYRLGSEADDFTLTASTTEFEMVIYGLPVNMAYILFKDTLTESG
jgi:hypothetical protein